MADDYASFPGITDLQVLQFKMYYLVAFWLEVRHSSHRVSLLLTLLLGYDIRLAHSSAFHLPDAETGLRRAIR